jgi:hypothetical protein
VGHHSAYSDRASNPTPTSDESGGTRSRTGIDDFGGFVRGTNRLSQCELGPQQAIVSPRIEWCPLGVLETGFGFRKRRGMLASHQNSRSNRFVLGSLTLPGSVSASCVDSEGTLIPTIFTRFGGRFRLLRPVLLW